MLEWTSGFLFVGLDGELYFAEHVWYTWTVRQFIDLEFDPALTIVEQESVSKVKAEGRYGL